MNLTTLKSLQKRIREATGPDRFLDADIWRKLVGDVLPPKDYPKLTTYPEGLGACVALMHERFPGALWFKRLDSGFEVYQPSTEESVGRFGKAKPLANDCLTFLDAIIAAKIAELEARETV